MVKQAVPYGQEIADEIINCLSTTTKGIKTLCRENPHWPDHTAIYRWCFTHEEFRNLYARAKSIQVEWLVEEALDVAYNGSGDTYTDDKGNVRCDNEWVQRSRLKVDTIKWIASKLAPKIYGDGGAKGQDNNMKSVVESVIDKL